MWCDGFVEGGKNAKMRKKGVGKEGGNVKAC
jgi:hypothetical protein